MWIDRTVEKVSERPLVEAALRALRGYDDSDSGWPGASTKARPAPVISGYRVVREIHRGGQGVVYQGVRESTGRTVAIKVMREGPFAGPIDRARFERELRLLAQLEHPNIVAVHDSGEAAGCSFFVVDYVNGEPLDAYVANEQPPLRKLLELFATIAETVNAAHVRGIIHRDLKPGNVLVDAQHAPKVLDFGLAKVTETGSSLASGWLLTETGQFLGSLPWSSPEQAEGKHELVDLRSDVYALGVMLFHALTGRFPYEVRGSVRKVLDNIVNAEPPRPSSLRRELDDETDTIVLTALAKEPDRRYQTAGDLARDLRRYLADEPIAAKRDSSVYLLRKTFRRHRAPLSVATLFVAVLAGSGWVTALQYRKTQDVQRESVVMQLGFLEEMFADVNPHGTAPQDVTVSELLANAADRVDEELADEPEAQGDVRHMMGTTYRRIGLYDDAIAQLEQALALRRSVFGDIHPKVADTLHQLGAAHWHNADFSVAEQFYEDALAVRRELFGEEHPAVADTLNHLAACRDSLGSVASAEALYTQALAMRRELLGPEHMDIAGSLNNFATHKRRRGQNEEALAYFEEALDMQRRLHGNDHAFVARGLTNLAGCLMDMKRYDEAAPLLTEALDIKRRSPAPDVPSIAITLHRLADLSFESGDYAAALRHCDEAIEIRRGALREDHPAIATSAQLAGEIRMAQGDAAGAEPFFAEAVRIRIAQLPPGDQQTLQSLESYVECLIALGKSDEVQERVEAALEVLQNRGLTDSVSAQYLTRLLGDLGQ